MLMNKNHQQEAGVGPVIALGAILVGLLLGFSSALVRVMIEIGVPIEHGPVSIVAVFGLLLIFGVLPNSLKFLGELQAGDNRK